MWWTVVPKVLPAPSFENTKTRKWKDGTGQSGCLMRCLTAFRADRSTLQGTAALSSDGIEEASFYVILELAIDRGCSGWSNGTSLSENSYHALI